MLCSRGESGRCSEFVKVVLVLEATGLINSKGKNVKEVVRPLRTIIGQRAALPGHGWSPNLRCTAH